MKRLSYLVTLSVIALLVLAPVAGAQQDQGVVSVPIQDVVTVSIHDFSFDPSQTTVAPGTVVMWTNNDNVSHTVTADDGSFDSETLNPGDSFMVVFEGSGTVSYHCEIHPFMTGSVTVSEGSGGSTAPTTGEPAGGTTDMSSGMDMGSSY